MATEALTDPRVEQAIHRMQKEYERNLNAGDDDRLAEAFYTDDARVLIPNAPKAEGLEAIADALEGLGESYSDVRIDGERVYVSGDLAVSEGRYEGTRRLEAGTTRPDRGKPIETYRREPDGSWRCFLDAFNSDLEE